MTDGPHRHASPWWLHGGDEECPHCGQPYHAEVERRCSGCDAPSCIHCLAPDSKLCPECVAEGRE